MSDAVIIKTRKFKRNPLLARKQVCFLSLIRLAVGYFVVGSPDPIVGMASFSLWWRS